MSPERLLKYFDQISEVPDAVPRLRRFILDLAVRGKLVEQNPEDEPAGELLKRVAAEKRRLAEEGQTRKQKPLAPIAEDEVPFNVPKNWKLVRLGEVSTLITKGSTPTSYGHSFVQHGINFVKVEAIKEGLLLPENITSHINSETHEFLKRSQLKSGDLLFSIAGSIGTCAVVTGQILPANTNQALAIIRGANLAFSLGYLSYSSRSDLLGLTVAKARGGAMNNISLEDVSNFVLPLPPQAEQRRIVAKVDELMALCDEFEVAQVMRERRRDRLVAATLHGLNNGNNSSEPEVYPTFEESARFYFNYLPRLTTRPEHIQQLRQTILNLALRGKLVRQDPNDEPAAALLKRIELEKQNLIKEGKLKKHEVLESSDKTIIPFDVSTGWEWEKAGALFLNVTDGFHNTPKPTDDGYRYLTAKHIRPGKIDFERCLYVDEKNHKELFAKTRVKRGDILIVNIGAGCGNPAIVEVDFEFSFKNVAILNLPSELDRDYILAFLLHYRTIVFDELIKGGAQPFLGLNMLRQMLIPVPPLAEQRRIVAKVNKLMALCDELEAQLATTNTTRHQLLEATISEALTP
jgi:type I restriction enzyme S subunit